MTLDDLLSALEAATEGSRELDRKIVVTLNPGSTLRRIPGALDLLGVLAATNEFLPIPDYTRSIDAALTLIPPNTYWHVGAGRTRYDEPMYGAMIQEANFDGKELGVGETNASPALALVIAALRARKAQP